MVNPRPPSSQVARILHGSVMYRVTITPFLRNGSPYSPGHGWTYFPADPSLTTIEEMDGMLACLDGFLKKANEEREKEFERRRAEEG